jgi:intron-binding protein aquarius
MSLIYHIHIGFEIDGKTGEAISDRDMVTLHASRMISLTKVAFKYLGDEGRTIALANSSQLDTRAGLHHHLNRMQTSSLLRLSRLLGLIGSTSTTGTATNSSVHVKDYTRDLLLEILLTHFELRRSQTKDVQSMSIFPPDNILWDMDLVPSMHYSGETALALPKVFHQLLTIYRWCVVLSLHLDNNNDNSSIYNS